MTKRLLKRNDPNTQLTDIEPLDSTLTPEQKKMAITTLIFLTEKRDGTIKVRQCAGARKQREYTNKEEAASPMVTKVKIFITSIIDTTEKRDVGVVDLLGAFIHAKND